MVEWDCGWTTLFRVRLSQYAAYIIISYTYINSIQTVCVGNIVFYSVFYSKVKGEGFLLINLTYPKYMALSPLQYEVGVSSLSHPTQVSNLKLLCRSCSVSFAIIIENHTRNHVSYSGVVQ